MDLDEDVRDMAPEALRDEVRRLRAGIRRHRDSSGHALCWYHPELWELLPERVEPAPEVPARDEFLRRCAAYRDSLDDKAG